MYKEDKKVKKWGLRAVAWSMLLAMMISSAGVPKKADADEDLSSEMLRVTMKELTNEDVLLVTEADTDENGTILIDNGNWEKIIIRRSEKIRKTVIRKVQAQSLVIEGGFDCPIYLENATITDVVVTVPETEGIGYLELQERLAAKKNVSEAWVLYAKHSLEVSGLREKQPNLQIKGNTKINELHLYSNAKVDAKNGKIENIRIETVDADFNILDVTVKNYKGTVTVDAGLEKTGRTDNVSLNVVGGRIAEVKLLGAGGRCEIKGKNASIQDVTIAGDFYLKTLANIENVTIEETSVGAKIKVYSEISNMDVKGNDSDVVLTNTARVQTAEVKGDNTRIYGYGKLESAEISGKNANVAVRGTKVEGENDTTIPQEMWEMAGGNGAAKPTVTPKPTQQAGATPTPVATPIPSPVTYDFRDGSVVPTTTDGKNDIVFGNLMIRKSATSAYQYNGAQHGVAFKNGNVLEIKVVGPAKIQVGDCGYSDMSQLTLTNADGTWSQTQESGKLCGGVVEFQYNGGATTLKLALTAQVYMPYLKVIPVEGTGEGEPSVTPTPGPVTYNFGDGSIVPTDTDGKSNIVHGKLTIKVGTKNAYKWNSAEHGTAFKLGNSIEIAVDGPVKVEVGDCQYSDGTSLTLKNADGSWSQTQTTKNGCYHNGYKTVFTYTGEATTLIFAFENQYYVPCIIVTPIELTSTPTPVPTSTPTPVPTSTPTPVPTSTPTPVPTSTPTPVPTSTPTPVPTSTPTPVPTSTPTPTPTDTPVAPQSVLYDFRDGSIVPTTTDGKDDIIYGDLTIRKSPSATYQYNGTQHGVAFKNGNVLEITVSGPVKVQVGDCGHSGMDNLTLENEDGTWSQTEDAAKACGGIVEFTYDGDATVLKLALTAQVYMPYLKVIPVEREEGEEPTPVPEVVTYNFKDATSIPSDLDGSQVYTTGALTLNPNYQYNNGHGYAFSGGSSIEIQVDGPTQIEIGNCQYNNMAEFTLVAKDIIWSQTVNKGTACGEAIVFTYPGEATTLVLNVNASIYVPYITTTQLSQEPEQLQKVTEYDFRDGSIIPTDTDGKSDVVHGDLTVKVGPSNAYVYNGAQHGVQFKAGNSIEIKVDGSVIVEVGDCAHSEVTSLTMTNFNGSWTQTEATKKGCLHNDGSALVFNYTGEATTLILAFDGSAYVPNIVVTTVVE